MKECIEREAARAQLILNDELHAADLIKSIPAADARPVVRGKWVHHGMVCGLEKCNCSLCGWYSFKRTNFCPNCGADMREQPKVDTQLERIENVISKVE